jgi:peptidoglycan/xylan/chitin deacetylase (PgdA/CDA1 family)
MLKRLIKAENKQKYKRPIAKIYPAGYKHGVLILGYHSINPGHRFSTSPQDFEGQMLFIKENYEVISLEDLNKIDCNSLAGGKIKVILTFDDGYEDNFIYAYPILKKLNLPATVFITTDFVFNNVDITKNWLPYNGLKPLNVSQVKEMLNNGISIGSHGKTHRRSSDLTLEEFIAELSESRQAIREHLGVNVNTYAFPYGQKKDCVRFSPSVFAENGYELVCTTSWGINFKRYNKFKLKRIRIDNFDTIGDFKQKLRGKWDFIKYFQAIKNLL